MLLMDCQWKIKSCMVQSTLLQAEIKTTEELIERKKNKLEELRSAQDCLVESGEYAMGYPLSNNDIYRNIYHRQKCLIGPHIQKLLDECAKVV